MQSDSIKLTSVNLAKTWLRSSEVGPRPLRETVRILCQGVQMASIGPSKAASGARTWLKTLNVLSPTAVFRARKNSEPIGAVRDGNRSGTAAQGDEPLQMMSLQVMDTLSHLIEFVEENHRREEGLYRREGSISECEDLCRFCAAHALPDLALYSPHSITAVIKQILAKGFEPLVPYHMSCALLEQAQERDDVKLLEDIVATFKQIRATTREFLKILLIHLYHVSTSIPCRMSTKSLATHVGVLLLRPSEEPRSLSTRTSMLELMVGYWRYGLEKRTILLIENATSLPYDCATEMHLTEIPEASASSIHVLDSPPVMVASASAVGETWTSEVHYIQVMWDSALYPQTEDSLRAILSKFGQIAMLAVNNSKNRAIVAFTSFDAAQAAAVADLPNLKVRRRRQRIMSSPSSSPEKTNSTLAPTEKLRTAVALSPRNASLCSEAPADLPERDYLRTASGMTSNPLQDIHPQDVESSPPLTSSPNFLHKLERPPSLLLEQKALQLQSNTSQQMLLEDVDSLPNSPQLPQIRDSSHRSMPPKQEDAARLQQALPSIPIESIDQAIFAQEGARKDDSRKTPVSMDAHGMRMEISKPHLSNEGSTTHSIHRELKPEPQHGDQTAMLVDVGIKKPTKKGIFSPTAAKKIGIISDLKHVFARQKNPRRSETRPTEAIAQVREDEATSVPVSQAVTVARDFHSKKTQTSRAYDHKGVDTTDLYPPGSSDTDAEESTQKTRIDELESLMAEVRNVLQTVASALGCAGEPSEMDRAVLQLHAQVIEIVDDTLSSPVSQQKLKKEQGTATSDFISFLEARAKTQVTLLEAEIRAGQELLRLHRSQHEREIAEMEGEVTGLRLMRVEAERMCADLRSELRKCRNELACHVANTAAIKRDKRDLEEKLVICENRLRASEQALMTAQISHDEMQAVAASAQIRLEAYRSGDTVSSDEKVNLAQIAEPHSQKNPHLPMTSAFLQKHHERSIPQSDSTRLRFGQQSVAVGSNTHELAAMKSKLQKQIQSQIESTRAALTEIHSYGNGRLIEDEEASLEQLQQQLASARGDMDAAMETSRRKLEILMNPTLDTSFESITARDQGNQYTEINPTELVQRLLTTQRSGMPTHSSERRDKACNFEIPHKLHIPTRQTGESGAQSELFKRWTSTRASSARSSGLPATRPYGDKSSLKNAQQSMQKFQETLAAMSGHYRA